MTYVVLESPFEIRENSNSHI